MKYCSKCGNKLKENVKFCNKCGNPTKIGSDFLKKKRDIKASRTRENIVLIVGMIFIILSGLIFLFINFKNFNGLLKTLFVSIECILFLVSGFILKKLDSNRGFKIFWFLGSIFIPIILYMICEYALLGKYLSFNGSGLSVYLAICSVICIGLYYISYKLTNFKLYLFFICFLIDILFINILCFFNTFIYKIFDICNIIFVLFMIYNLIISIVCLRKKQNVFFKCFNSYMKFLMIILLFFVMTLVSDYQAVFDINVLLVCIFYIVTLYIVLLFDKKGIYSYYSQILITIVSWLFINTLFKKFTDISLYILALVTLLQLFISYILNIKGFKIINIITSFLSFIIICLMASYKTGIIIGLLIFTALLFLLKIEKNNSIKKFINIIIPVSIYYIVYSILKNINLFQTGYIILVASLLYYVIYSYLLVRKNNNSRIYELYSYFALLILFLMQNYNIVTSILISIVWIYFLISKLRNNNKDIFIRNFLYFMCIINLIVNSGKFNIGFYNSILILSILFIIIGKLFEKFKLNYKMTYIIGIILLIIVSIFSIGENNVLMIILNFALYLFIYILEFVNKKKNSIIRFLYTFIGFILMYSIMSNVGLPSSLSSILTLILFVLILITMYLSEIDSDKNIFSYSVFCLMPIVDLMDEIPFINVHILEFNTILFIIYMFIFTEFIFNIKKKDKITLQIIILSLAFINTIKNTNVFMFVTNSILAIIYIFIGFKRKSNEYIYLGCIMLIITVLIQLINIKSVALFAFTLLGIGLILILYVIMKEIRKNNK